MLFPDVETYCDLDLRKVSLDRYVSHPSFRILMCAYAFDEGPVMLWQEGEPMNEVQAAIIANTCVPWNKGFEENSFRKGWKIEAKDWLDAMVIARYAGLPAGLKDCNRVPFFANESVTSKETLLINKFCKPSKNGVVHNRDTDPEDWALFCQYCKDDVQDTRLIYQWLIKRFDIPDRVHKAWLLNQEINKRGMPIDLAMTAQAWIEAQRLQAESLQKLKDLTGLENPNSPAQLLKWVAERGYPFGGLGKELVKKALEDDIDTGS